jgi:hypothetical protein
MPTQVPRAGASNMLNSDYSDFTSQYTTVEDTGKGMMLLVGKDKSRETGIKMPVYFSKSVWDKYVEVPSGMEDLEDLPARLWDLLRFYLYATKNNPLEFLEFEIICRVPNANIWEAHEKPIVDSFQKRVARLKSVVRKQHDDNPSPAIFIMKPDED